MFKNYFKIAVRNFLRRKDYFVLNLHKAIQSQLIILWPDPCNVYSVKTETANVADSITAIRTKWNAYFPADPFNYYFLDEVIRQ